MTANVSIHATLAGGDQPKLSTVSTMSTVSIHATLAGGDLSTLPRGVGGACFYPRHPRGWRRACFCKRHPPHNVSIHATLAGGDGSPAFSCSFAFKFLSTPPSRVATDCIVPVVQAVLPFLSTPPSRVATSICISRLRSCTVSIHATLAGGDGKSVQKCTVSFAQKGKNYL